MDLATLLDGQPLLILTRDAPLSQARVTREAPSLSDHGDGVLERVRAIRSQTHQSWSNIRKAARALQGRDHEPFGTPNVENSAKSCVRKIQREVGLSPEQIETLLDRNGVKRKRLRAPKPNCSILNCRMLARLWRRCHYLA